MGVLGITEDIPENTEIQEEEDEYSVESLLMEDKKIVGDGKQDEV